jgi:hypothetical protein
VILLSLSYKSLTGRDLVSGPWSQTSVRKHLAHQNGEPLAVAYRNLCYGFLDIAALSNSQSRSEEASSFFRELQHQIVKALVLTRSAWAKYRSFSLYSLIAVVATFVAFPLVVPEAIIAARKLRPF